MKGVEAREAEGAGNWREGRKIKRQLCNPSSKKCLEKEVCLNSWQPCVPWLECGNSPGVFHVIPLEASSAGSYGNIRAMQWQSHLMPTSAGDK